MSVKCCIPTKLRKGDKVQIIAGKDKGAQGIILRVLREDQSVVVEGVNLIKKHVKPNPAKDIQGGIIEREAAVHISNVALFNPTSGKGEKIAYKQLADGKKIRVFRSNGEQVDA